MHSATSSLLLLLSASLTPTSAFASTPAPSQLEIQYFDLRGAAETSRVLLAITQQPYTDTRFAIDPSTFQSQSFLEAKQNGSLKMNLNRAPVLLTPEGQTIGQSKAIERYIAKKFGLMGKTPEDEAVIDCIAEHCRDVRDAARAKGFSAFNKQKSEEEKASARKEWFETDMPEMLRKIDEAVRETGMESEDGSYFYAFGSSTSYADVAIWAMLRDCLEGDREDTKKASEGCAVLNKIADGVESLEGVKKWLEERPVTMF